MDITSQSVVRHDFTATDGETNFAARLYENVVTVNVGSVQFAIPADDLGSLTEFLTGVAAQITANAALSS